MIFTLVGGILCGCGKNVHSQLEGCWVESVNMGDTSIYQGFTLKADSICSSINMATLKYSKWSVYREVGSGNCEDSGNLQGSSGCEKSGHKIVLHGRSIGNGQTIDFIDTLTIQKLSADSLIVLNSGGAVTRYFRVEPQALRSLLGGVINPLDSLTINPLMGDLAHKTYSGTIPAADCPGIVCTLDLWSQQGSTKEGVYRFSMKYLEATPEAEDVTNTTQGRYFTLLGLTEVYGEQIMQLVEFEKEQGLSGGQNSGQGKNKDADQRISSGIETLNFYVYPSEDSIMWLGAGYTRIDSPLNYNLRLITQ